MQQHLKTLDGNSNGAFLFVPVRYTLTIIVLSKCTCHQFLADSLTFSRKKVKTILPGVAILS